MTCSPALQAYSRPSPHAGHSMGRATNTEVQATASHRLRSQSTRATGTAHTLWCDQEMGDASSIASDASPAPSIRSPSRHHLAATYRTAPATAPASATHSSTGGGSPRSRVSTPYSDWLWASAGGPTRLASRSPSDQYAAPPG